MAEMPEATVTVKFETPAMFVVVLYRRFKSLATKLVSVKTIPAAIFTVGYLRQPDVVNGGLCLLSWALVVGYRYAEKVMNIRPEVSTTIGAMTRTVKEGR
jgi:hypothetical protein